MGEEAKDTLEDYKAKKLRKLEQALLEEYMMKSGIESEDELTLQDAQKMQSNPRLNLAREVLKAAEDKKTVDVIFGNLSNKLPRKDRDTLPTKLAVQGAIRRYKDMRARNPDAVAIYIDTPRQYSAEGMTTYFDKAGIERTVEAGVGTEGYKIFKIKGQKYFIANLQKRHSYNDLDLEISDSERELKDSAMIFSYISNISKAIGNNNPASEKLKERYIEIAETTLKRYSRITEICKTMGLARLSKSHEAQELSEMTAEQKAKIAQSVEDLKQSDAWKRRENLTRKQLVRRQAAQREELKRKHAKERKNRSFGERFGKGRTGFNLRQEREREELDAKHGEENDEFYGGKVNDTTELFTENLVGRLFGRRNAREPRRGKNSDDIRYIDLEDIEIGDSSMKRGDSSQGNISGAIAMARANSAQAEEFPLYAGKGKQLDNKKGKKAVANLVEDIEVLPNALADAFKKRVKRGVGSLRPSSKRTKQGKRECEPAKKGKEPEEP